LSFKENFLKNISRSFTSPKFSFNSKLGALWTSYLSASQVKGPPSPSLSTCREPSILNIAGPPNIQGCRGCPDTLTHSVASSRISIGTENLSTFNFWRRTNESVEPNEFWDFHLIPPIEDGDHGKDRQFQPTSHPRRGEFEPEAIWNSLIRAPEWSVDSLVGALRKRRDKQWAVATTSNTHTKF